MKEVVNVTGPKFRIARCGHIAYNGYEYSFYTIPFNWVLLFASKAMHQIKGNADVGQLL